MKTPLHKAVSQGHKDVSIALLEAGADTNVIDAKGHSPLDTMLAASPYMMTISSEMDGNSEQSTSRTTSGVKETGETRDHDGLGSDRNWEELRGALERHGGHYHRVLSVEGCGDNGVNLGGVGVGSSPATPGPSGCRKASVLVLSNACDPRTGTDDSVFDFSPAVPRQLAERELEFAHSRSNRSVDAEESRLERGLVSGVGTPPVGVNDSRMLATSASPDFSNTPKEALPPVMIARDDGCRNDSVPPSEVPGGRGGSPESVGMKCGECQVPVVTMVRALCCRGLLCKSCSRVLRVQGRSCSLCRNPNKIT